MNRNKPPALLSCHVWPARWQVNAERYDGKFMRRRREWKRGSNCQVALKLLMAWFSSAYTSKTDKRRCTARTL